MISYLDRTFCSFYKNCKYGDYCARSLTPKIEDDAEAFGLPVARFLDPPSCYDQKEVKKDEQGK